MQITLEFIIKNEKIYTIARIFASILVFDEVKLRHNAGRVAAPLEGMAFS